MPENFHVVRIFPCGNYGQKCMLIKFYDYRFIRLKSSPNTLFMKITESSRSIIMWVDNEV